MSEEIDTANDQLVAVKDEQIVVMAPKRIMTKDEALRHAAWLIACSGDEERFKQILQAVRNT